jgi:hypothetical protein
MILSNYDVFLFNFEILALLVTLELINLNL